MRFGLIQGWQKWSSDSHQPCGSQVCIGCSIRLRSGPRDSPSHCEMGKTVIPYPLALNIIIHICWNSLINKGFWQFLWIFMGRRTGMKKYPTKPARIAGIIRWEHNGNNLQEPRASANKTCGVRQPWIRPCTEPLIKHVNGTYYFVQSLKWFQPPCTKQTVRIMPQKSCWKENTCMGCMGLIHLME